MARYQLAWPSQDPLGEALHALRMSGSFYCRSQLSHPWGLWMPDTPGCLWFHAVTAGGCELVLADGEARRLRAGEFALVTRGEGHTLRTGPGPIAPNVLQVPHEEVSEHYALLRHGGGGEETALVCGVIRFAPGPGAALVKALPPLIVLDGALNAGGLRTTLRLLARESRRLSPGGDTVVTRLADILVIQAIRAWLARGEAGTGGWLSALRDPQLGRALSAVHHEPGRPWSVAALASAAGMSRAGFAARFVALTGEPPMHYVARVRMELAAQLLARPGARVGEIAARLGYRSEAAFSRAFSRLRGEAPGRSKRASRAASA